MVRIGFIGCGGIARLHMSNLAKIENVEIVAHTDVDIKKAEETARLYGGCLLYTSPSPRDRG